MAQDNGNITAFCTTHNHENVIVNIPELIASALGGAEELTTDEEKLKVTITSTDEGTTDVNIERPIAEPPAAEQPETQQTVRIRRPKVKNPPFSF